MRPQIPECIHEQAKAANKRLEDAMTEALMLAFSGFLPGDDDFHRQIVELMDEKQRRK